MPKAQQKFVATGDDMEEGDEEIPLHRTIDKEETKLYTWALEDTSILNKVLWQNTETSTVIVVIPCTECS